MKKQQYIRCILCTAMVMAMFLIASIVKEHEIIFPETLALCIGAWYANQLPWRVTKCKLVVLMSIASILGVCIVRYLPDYLFLQITVGFLLVAILLTLFHSTLFPIISACILPIMLHTDRFLYCLSVMIISILIVLIQWALEHAGLKPQSQMSPYEPALKQECMLWAKRLVIYLFLAFIAIYFSKPYLIAPPLIVLFTELTKDHSPLKNRPVQLVLLFTSAATIGTILRLFLMEQLHWPAFLCAGFGTLLLFLLMQLLTLYVPPAGACLLLAFLLPDPLTILYPICICIGTALFTIASLLFFRKSPDSQINSDEHVMTPVE